MTTYPVARSFFVTSPFGPRTGQYSGMHWGTDFGNGGGSGGHPVYAARSGTVQYAGPASGFGQWVTVDHPASVGGGYSVYGHVIPEVRPGQAVREGQRIARINPDSATNGGVAPHLHFEWHRLVWSQPGPGRIDPMTILAGASYPGEAPTTTPAPAPDTTAGGGMTIFGIDVSEHQNGIYLGQAAREGVKFAIIRTNDGTHKDRVYTSHLADAERAGLVTAAYAFLRNPSEGTSIAAQVQATLEVMGQNRRPIWLDCETPAGLSAAHIREFHDRYEAAGLRVVGAYSYVPWWEGKTIGGEPDSRQFGAFWVAAYPGGSGTLSQIYSQVGGDGAARWSYPLGNQKPVLWQFTDRAAVAGYNVDGNAYRGSVESLRALFYGGDAGKEDDDMSAEAERKIDAIYNQLAGSFKQGEFPGWDIDALYKSAAAKGFSKLTMMEGVAVAVKESILTGDQLSGPGRNADGARTFAGWDIPSVLAAARKRNYAGLTLVQMLAVSTFGTDEDRAAIAAQVGGKR